MEKGVCGRLKMDVPGQGSGKILDVDGKEGLGGLEKWTIFMAVSCWMDFVFVCTDTSCYIYIFDDVIRIYFPVSFYSIAFITNQMASLLMQMQNNIVCTLQRIYKDPFI